MLQYKTIVYRENFWGSLLLGGSKIDPIKFTEFLNQNAALGWKVICMDKDIQRIALFFKREAYVVIMEKSA